MTFCINLLPALLAATPCRDSLLQYALPMTHDLLYQLTTCLTCRHTLPGLPAPLCSTNDSLPAIPTYYLLQYAILKPIACHYKPGNLPALLTAVATYSTISFLLERQL
jgi:hypothetical protein